MNKIRIYGTYIGRKGIEDVLVIEWVNSYEQNDLRFEGRYIINVLVQKE